MLVNPGFPASTRGWAVPATLRWFLDEVFAACQDGGVHDDPAPDDRQVPGGGVAGADGPTGHRSGPEEPDPADLWLDEMLARVRSGRSLAPARGCDDPTAPTAEDGRTDEDSQDEDSQDDDVARPDHLEASLVCPPGYQRHGRDRWRYEATARLVPGARDVTLASLYDFGRSPDGSSVLVPVLQARTEPELAWVLELDPPAKMGFELTTGDGRGRTVLEVPAGEWEGRAGRVIGLVAPELVPHRLLDIEGVARVAGVTPQTVSTYLARGRMPEPVGRLGNSPVWTRPQIQHWLAARPGQGVGGGRPASTGRRRQAGSTGSGTGRASSSSM